MFRVVRLLLIFCVVNSTLSQNFRQKRITDGRSIEIEKQPFIVSLFSNRKYICGGSILSSKWIMTAAHCLLNQTQLDVHAGSKYIRWDGITLPSKKLILHPDYDDRTLDYDVGLIDLGDNALELNNSTIKAVKLADSNSNAGDNTHITVSGWGVINERGSKTFLLKQINSTTLNNDVCKSHYSDLTDRMICTAPGSMKACRGDSGGPLIVFEGEVQIGIVSWGDKLDSAACDHVGLPSVYTRVSHPAIRDWIKNVTGV